MKKILFTGVLLLAAICLVGAQQSYAYDNVTSTPDGGCLACHAFAGGGGTAHTTHSTATVACTSCHDVSPGAVPVKSSKCLVCHPTANAPVCDLVIAHAAASTSCITCHPTCTPPTTTIPPGNPAACADWIGSWNFTYDNSTITTVCFDNTSITSDTLTVCDNDSAANCVCLNDVTAKLFCVDNSTYAQCDNDSTPGCTCIDNPYYKAPGPNGVKAVTITAAVTNLTFQGQAVPCLAQGTRGAKAVNIVQVNDATATKYGLANLTYLVFEGTTADFDNITFAQILPAKFTKDNNSVDFVAEEDLNSLDLVSGTKAITPIVDNCTLTIFPKKYGKVRAILEPFQVFIIRAPKDGDIEFAKPVAIDWGNDAINDIIKIRLGKKMIFGIIFVRPFKLVTGEYQVDVTYGETDKTACGPITVK